MTLPNPFADNSDSVVVGQNTLRSITCIIDGHSFILWNGTYFGGGVTYYLPRVTQFSALMSVSKGQHSLQINVSAISEYAVEGTIPFAQRIYNISANQTTTFNVDNDSNSILSPTLYSVKCSYEIWQDPDSTSSSIPTSSDSSVETPSTTPSLIPSTPSPSETLTPSPTLTPSESPTLTPSASPAQQPTLEPTQTPDRPKIVDFAPLLIPGVMIFLATFFVGLLVYLAKHRETKYLVFLWKNSLFHGRI